MVFQFVTGRKIPSSSDHFLSSYLKLNFRSLNLILHLSYQAQSFNLVTRFSETEANFASKFSDISFNSTFNVLLIFASEVAVCLLLSSCMSFNFDSKVEASFAFSACMAATKVANMLCSWLAEIGLSLVPLVTSLLPDTSTVFWILLSTFLTTDCSSSWSEIVFCSRTRSVQVMSELLK